MELEVMSPSQSVLEKLQFNGEKNILVQGLPSTVEKQFSKLSFSKNVTPLLKSRKIDFALVFAISQKQLNDILKDVIPALQKDAKLWVAYPKVSSKIVSDLCRDCKFEFLTQHGFEGVRLVALDHVWSAMNFKKTDQIKKAVKQVDATAIRVAVEEIDFETRIVTTPADLESLFTEHRSAKEVFDKLAFSHKKEYVEWITGAKKEETRTARLHKTIEKLKNGKKNPSEK
ncbi:YdeI/OmpD-associated family protein [Ferruginibacter lapsinanis]|uniref:YdeI/OmpD-associated family protein n=1 Tax=Ferruginibacter lapsinanis TaxID=563172 RepID=UPI001E496B45|nr:YdeI/OmpD-associated family protein [Ferruginibacter lapsinanis]UEG49130.1 YdeI/OmpD-associated family protein [Ferruginibacter lapsinanis]